MKRESLINKRTKVSELSKKLFTLFIIILMTFSSKATIHTITIVGNTFTPDTLVVNVGDSINVVLGGYHDVTEVDQSTWLANGTTYNGGFLLPGGSGGGQFIVNTAQTYYYVCIAHVGWLGMKGIIIANALPIYGCTDPTATNYDPLATVDDSSCTYVPSSCASLSPTGAYISELIHDRVRVNWDNMNDANCMVTQYRIRYRELGTSTWLSKTMANSGL
jgi:plastocyanin